MKAKNTLLQTKDLKCLDAELNCIVEKLLIKKLKDLISADANNTIILGSDGKLFVA